MRTICRVLLGVWLVFTSVPAFAEKSRSSSSRSSTGSVSVRGYTRKDGTYVRPYYRSAPGTRSYSSPSTSSRTRSYSSLSTSLRTRSYSSPSTSLRTRSSWTPPAAAFPPVGGKVHVRGHTRKDGAYVPPHYRSAPGTGTARIDIPTGRRWGTVRLDGSSELSKLAASHPVRQPAVRLPAFRYNASTSNRKAREYLERSEAAKRRFMRQTGYPHGRPGYVVDHVVPLACGGRDEPSNMQWQTIEEAKKKDIWERRACS